MVDHFTEAEVSTGAAYEVHRAGVRERLALTAEGRRVVLDGAVAIVFETRATVHAALEELLRAERVTDPRAIAAEVEAFSALLGGPSDLVATLYLDVADPVALSDRLAELPGIAAAVSLDIGAARVSARPEPSEDVSGAFALRFPLDAGQRAALLDGAEVSVTVDHPHCRARATLDPDQVRVIAVDLRR